MPEATWWIILGQFPRLIWLLFYSEYFLFPLVGPWVQDIKQLYRSRTGKPSHQKPGKSSWSPCTNVRIRFDFDVFAFISMSALSCYCNIVKTRVHLRGMIFLRAAKRADQKGGSLRPLRNATECVQCAPAKYWSTYWVFMSIGFVFDQKTSQQCQQSTYSTAAFLFAVKKLLGANLARVY